VVTLRLDGAEPADVERAAAILRDGGLVAFPTETVYGLGADGLSPEAVARVFRAKGRPPDNPLILHVADVEAARALWVADAGTEARARRLAGAFWPGPLTLVLPRAEAVPDAVSAGQETVGVRVPDHPVARALLEAVGRPLAAPSANRSGRPSPTTAEHVLATLDGRIEAVLDGGPTRVGVESTVLSLAGPRPRILRPGAVTAEELAPFLPGLDAGPPRRDDLARSPGLRHRHYAPRGVILRLEGPEAMEEAWTEPVALLCRTGTAAGLRHRLGDRTAPVEALPDDAAGFARGLYGALYRLERSGVQEAVVERPPDGGPWTAVRDRLIRASRG
jgi:L-threonylcarbamoyladenylate synthase